MIDATRSGIIEKPVIASMAKSVIFFNGYFVVPESGAPIVKQRNLLKANPANHPAYEPIAFEHLNRTTGH